MSSPTARRVLGSTAVVVGIALLWGVLFVAFGTADGTDDSGDTRATPCTDACGPLGVDTLADLRLPVGAHRREEVGVVVRRPRVVRAVDRRDLRARQSALGVDRLDLCVVPTRDLAEVDLRQQWSAQPQDCGPRALDYSECALRAVRFARRRLMRTATNTPASGANQYAWLDASAPTCDTAQA